jgi:hypothetical protein
MSPHASPLRLFLLLLLAGATALSAQSPIGQEFRIDGTHRARARQPAVGLSADGSLLAVWENSLEGLMARTVDAAGQPVGQDLVLVADDAEPGYPYRGVELASRNSPVLILDGSGFLLAWTEEVHRVSRDYFYRDEVLLGQDVYVQRFEQGGTPVGSAMRLSSSDNLDRRPAIARLADGRAAVVWESRHGDADSIQGRFVTASGDADGPLFTLGAGQRPAVAGGPSGGFLAVWQSDADGTFDVFARGYDGTGAAHGAAERVNASVAGHQIAPQVVAAGGRFVVAWQASGEDGVRLHTRSVNAVGKTTGAQLAATEGAFGDDHSSPTLTASGNDVLLLWMAWMDDFRQGVWGRFVRNNTLTRPFQVSQGVINGQFRLGAASNAQGRHLVVWEGFDDAGESALEGRFVEPVQASGLSLCEGGALVFHGLNLCR